MDYMKKLLKKITQHDVFGLAAQLSYFFLLSLFPLLLFIMALIGFLPIDEQSLLDTIGVVAPAGTMDLIQSNISMLINEQNGGLLSISVLATLWSASNGVNALTKAMNRAYEVEENRTFIVSRLIALVLTLAMIAVIVLAILLPILGKMIGTYVFSLVGLSADFLKVWNLLRWVITSIVFFIVFLAFYKLAPNKHIHFRDAMEGALFTTICWQLVSFGFSYYVSSFGNYTATYGSLGAVIVLMIWFYISGIIMIIGGIINAMKIDKIIKVK